MSDEPLDPPKLIDVLERELFREFSTKTAYQYRYAVKKLAVSLGYEPTAKDLRSHVLDWLETRLTIEGQTRLTIAGVMQRLYAISRWYSLRQFEGRASA